MADQPAFRFRDLTLRAILQRIEAIRWVLISAAKSAFLLVAASNLHCRVQPESLIHTRSLSALAIYHSPNRPSR